MIGYSGIAGIQATWSGLRAASRSAWGGLPASSPASRFPQVRDVFEFSPFVSPDPLVEDAIAAAASPAAANRPKALSMIEQYRKWLAGTVGNGTEDGWMTLADAVRDRVDLGSYTLLAAARTRSQEAGSLLAADAFGTGGGGPFGELLAANAAWSIRSDIYASRARAASVNPAG